MRRTRLFAAALALALAPALAFAQELTVLAAASLKGSLDALAADFTATTGVKVRVSFAASSALARQAESGAPAGLFVSADADWMDYLDQRGLLLPGTRGNLLANDLVLVAPKDSKVQLKIAPGFAIGKALGEGRIALAQPDSVPAGKYAKAAFTSLGVWADLEKRVAGADNVRAALALVARGEAPLGVVYRTDAIAEPAVRTVGVFPAGSHPPIVYPVAVLKGAQEEAGKRFQAFLRSPAARVTWQMAGFRPAL
jgi:molybdate transport system substrate-binding protein